MNREDPELFDIAVIGGGVNGCGIARDAAGRGAKVLLLERGDLAQGTSSASTKLVHGGLRYLEHYEFGLVREALSERERLWAIAPHIIWPMRFVLPHRKGLRPRWLLRLGLFLYDHIGGRKALPPTQSLDLQAHPAGVPLKAGFKHAYAYSDGWVDDARLVVLNALDAADKGASVKTRTEVVALARHDGRWKIETQGAGQNARAFYARSVVNAAGPSVLSLLDRASLKSRNGMRLVRGSHIVVRRLFEHEYAYFFQLPDGRIFFAIPYERDFTLIGTTDRDHDSGPVQASEEEIQYLCDGANQYFEKQIGPDEVVWTYSGVRPLIDDGSGKPEAATRGYTFELDGGKELPPILSVFGGKITSYRHLASDALDKLAGCLPGMGAGGWTEKSPLPGGDFPMNGQSRLADDYAHKYPFLRPEWIDRLVKTYGTLAGSWLGGAASLDTLGPHFGGGLTGAEVDYLIEREWARSVEDILWRRTKLGLRLDAAETSKLHDYISDKLGNS